MTIPSLQLWLRADRGVTLNGLTVSSWADQSPNTKTAFTQGTANQQPVFEAAGLGGKPCLNFDGVNDNLAAAIRLFSLLQLTEHSWFIVFQPITLINTVAVGSFFSGDPLLQDSTNALIGFSSRTNAGVELMAGIDLLAGGNTAATGAAPAGANYYAQFTHNPNDSKVHLSINGGADITITAASLNGGSSSVQMAIGRNYNSTTFANARIAEIVCCDRALGAVDIAALKAYFSARYGI